MPRQSIGQYDLQPHPNMGLRGPRYTASLLLCRSGAKKASRDRVLLSYHSGLICRYPYRSKSDHYGKVTPAVYAASPETVQVATENRFVDLRNVRIAYDRDGSGSAVVFLHGGLLDRRMWASQFSFFARNYCAIRYDMRDAGQSEAAPSAEPFTHHEDLFRLLQGLQIERVSLVGQSNHAVALDFAIAYPKLVQKLVLVSPGLRGYEFHDPWVGTEFAAMIRALEQQDLSGAVEVFLRMWVDGPYRTPTEVDPVVRQRAREMAMCSLYLSRATPNCKGLEPLAVGRLSEVHSPTLIVLGDRDAPDIHRIGKLIHEGIEGSKLLRLRDVGHTLVMENPDEFNRVVEDFLQL